MTGNLTDRLTRTRQMLNAIAVSVAQTGEAGAPSGPIYAALMGWLSLDEYQRLVSVLVEAGLVRLEHHVLYATPKLLEAVREAEAAQKAEQPKAGGAV